jgi:hypothetical protein
MATKTLGALPKNTPLGQLVPKSQSAKLTPAARKLTKAELSSLDKWASAGGKGKAPDHLTVRDLSSLKKAFPKGKGQRDAIVAQGSVACCCTTPCCSCSAAAIVPTSASGI